MERRQILRIMGGAAAFACPSCLNAASAFAGAAAKGGKGPKGHGGGAPHWSYTGDGAPTHWGELSPAFRVCDLGVQQSPVDIKDALGATTGGVKVRYNDTALRILNNGHTIQANCDPGSTIVLDGKTFKLLQFHFHHPSEHLLDGHTFEMEAHFVHAAADGTLAVLGVFIKPGSHNASLESVFAHMPAAAGPEQATRTRIAPVKMLPSDLQFFRYLGSLTTPPCSQRVIWTVYKQPVEASRAQIGKFAQLFPMNARPAQPLNRRFLLKSL